MRSTKALVCALVALAALAPACSSTPPEPSPSGAPSVIATAEPAPSDRPLAALELSIPQRTPAEAAARAGAVASVLTHATVGRASVAALEEALAHGTRGASARLVDRPHVSIGHHPRLDAVWAIDQDVSHDVQTDTDVGVDAATSTFRQVVADLESAELVDASVLDVAGAHVSHVMQASGRSGGPAPIERVKEYVFFAPRTIDGLQVGDAGVRVSVHRSGKVASIRVEGPVVDAVREGDGRAVPGAHGHAVTRAVSETDLDARVKAENPGAKIESLGLMYWMPAGVGSAVVAPRQSYAVYPSVEIGGVAGPGRGHRALYAVDDAGADPILDPPTATPEAQAPSR